jgi:polyhydroxybutyrate depolymerase
VRRGAWVGILALGLVGPAEEAAAVATLVDDQRSLFVRNETCTSPCPVELTKLPFFPGFPFNDIITGIQFNDWSSSQSSTVTGGELAGSGFTDTFTSLGEGRSRYDVTFSLNEVHAFDFTGALEAEGNAGSLAQFSHEDTATTLFLYGAGPFVGGPLNVPMDELGVLPAGLYRLQVEGVVLPSLFQGGDADWSFVLTLPEPGSGVSLVAGILSLAALRLVGGRGRRRVRRRAVIGSVLLLFMANPGIGWADPSRPIRSTGCGLEGLAAGDHEFVVEFDGMERTFAVHVPAIHDNNVPSPVLMNFHSLLFGGPRLRHFFSTMSNQGVKSEEAGFILIEADGTPHNDARGRVGIYSWNAGEACCNPEDAPEIDDVGYVVSVLDQMLETLCVDRRRIFASGMSNGGYMSHRLACEIPEYFAAIAPVVGSFSPELVCEGAGGMPVLQISGSLDNLASRQASVDRWLTLNECGPETTVTVEDDTTCTTHTNCKGGVVVRHCVVDQGNHCFFTNAELPFMTRCPARPDVPLAHDMIWDFASDWALVKPVPNSTHGDPRRTCPAPGRSVKAFGHGRASSFPGRGGRGSGCGPSSRRRTRSR